MAINAFNGKHAERKAYMIAGPTSGIGRATAFEIAKHDKLILVDRNPEKLNELQSAIEKKGGRALSVLCDLSDIASLRRASTEIIALELPIVGLLNNAGISPMHPSKSAQG